MLDSDPYIVISKDGRLYWIVDAYTVSSMLPYSKPLKNRVNYMRNSVKAIVDAYNGSVSLFISDSKDPIISVYRKIFPGMFKSMDEMPEDLKAHVRFPRDLFKVQATMYGTYHMKDPKIFYNKEDLWEIPVHGDKKIEPYYLIMKLRRKKKRSMSSSCHIHRQKGIILQHGLLPGVTMKIMENLWSIHSPGTGLYLGQDR